MKKNDWLLALSALSFSLLFYDQEPGLNFLLFDILLIAGLVVRSNSPQFTKSYLLAVFVALATGTAVFIYGNGLSFIANLFALMLLSARSIDPRTSVFAAALFSVYTGIGSGLHMVLDYLKRQDGTPKRTESTSFGKWLLWILPVILVLVFFALYRLSSPVFNQFASGIDFSFIEFGWIMCTLVGFWLAYAFFFHRGIQPFSDYDSNASNQLNSEETNLRLLGYQLTINEERQSGMLLFGLLNALLLVVNALDFGYLISGKIPAGMSYSEYVHQGTEALIFSIIIAIGIITIYFRNGLSLLQTYKPVRLLAYAWLIQNLALVSTTLIRNQLYINEYSLTYKRIGVYAFLVLALVGLLSAVVKIAARKSNYFLIRFNSGSLFAILVFCSLISWDQLIYSVNVKKAAQTSEVDLNYLLELSYAVLPNLQELNDKYPPKDKANKKALDVEIAQQTFLFLKQYQQGNWRSFTVRNYMVYRKLMQQHEQGKLVSLNLGKARISTFRYLKPLTQLNTLELDSGLCDSYKSLKGLANLKTLRLNNSRNLTLSLLRDMPQLEHFTAVNSHLATIQGIEHLSGLQTLDISSNQLTSLNGLEKLLKLEELNISNNPSLNDLSPLYQITSLRKLYLDQRLADLLLPNGGDKKAIDELREKLPNLEVFVVK